MHSFVVQVVCKRGDRYIEAMFSRSDIAIKLALCTLAKIEDTVIQNQLAGLFSCFGPRREVQKISQAVYLLGTP